MERVRKLVEAYEASSVLLRERERDDEADGDRENDGSREPADEHGAHAGIDREFVAGSWSAPRRRHRTARRGGR
jgi:hypothetical protein